METITKQAEFMVLLIIKSITIFNIKIKINHWFEKKKNVGIIELTTKILVHHIV